LKKFIENYERIVILGIGNEIRGDDALGSIIAKNLYESFNKCENILVFDGGMVPENYTGLIRKEKPTHIILLDAVDMKEDPGCIRIVEKDEIANYNISTHAMPMTFLISYRESTTDSKIILIGIQPKNMDITQNISKEVEKSIKMVVDVFEKLLKI